MTEQEKARRETLQWVRNGVACAARMTKRSVAFDDEAGLSPLQRSAVRAAAEACAVARALLAAGVD